METITIYELLGMVKDGKAPKKIKYKYIKYNFDSDGIYTKKIIAELLLECNYNLNDEVEILEETPKVQVEITQEEYFKYLDEQHKYMEQVKNYKPKPSYLKKEEEKKIPEKLEIEQDGHTYNNFYIVNQNGTKCYLTKHSKMIAETVNQVIDYLQYLKSKGE